MHPLVQQSCQNIRSRNIWLVLAWQHAKTDNQPCWSAPGLIRCKGAAQIGHAVRIGNVFILCAGPYPPNLGEAFSHFSVERAVHLIFLPPVVLPSAADSPPLDNMLQLRDTGTFRISLGQSQPYFA